MCAARARLANEELREARRSFYAAPTILLWNLLDLYIVVCPTVLS